MTGLRPPKAEVLRYLGYRGQEMDASLSAMVDTSIAECAAAATPRSVSREFAVTLRGAEEGDPLVELKGGFIAPGRDLWAHLRGCTRCVCMAATLGVGVEALIRRYETADLTRSLILDACATALIEEFCDREQENIGREAANRGMGMTARFSPGYGDLPLSLQPVLIELLNAERRVGLTCSERFLLLPRKSVTALIGLGEWAAGIPGGACGHRCAQCGLAGCPYREKTEGNDA